MAHAIIVLLLEFAMLFIGLIILLLNRMFPLLEAYFVLIEKCDIWTVLALLVLFAAYTIVRVAIRLIRGIIEEVAGEDARIP